MIKRGSTIWAAAVMCALAVGAQAGMFDLTALGSSAVINDAVFLQAAPGSTGTGVIQSFLRIQANGVEQGYNTDYKPFEFDEKAGNFTRSLMKSDVPRVCIDNVVYREFLLDINESSGRNGSLLSLDSLQVFLGTAPDLHGYPAGLGTLIYDMNAPASGNWIMLDYSLNSGSGSGDMFFYVPDRLFSAPGDYVYLYSQFGAQGDKNNGLGADAGFEEWAVRKLDNYVPEFANPLAAMLGMTPFALLAVRRRR